MLKIPIINAIFPYLYLSSSWPHRKRTRCLFANCKSYNLITRRNNRHSTKYGLEPGTSRTVHKLAMSNTPTAISCLATRFCSYTSQRSSLGTITFSNLVRDGDKSARNGWQVTKSVTYHADLTSLSDSQWPSHGRQRHGHSLAVSSLHIHNCDNEHLTRSGPFIMHSLD